MPNSPGYDRARSFAGTPLFAIVNAVVCVTAAIAAVTCAILWAVTFTPWARHLPSAVFVPFFALMFPLFGWAVLVLTVARPSAASPRTATADWMQAIPRRARFLVLLAAAAAVVGAATAVTALGGQPVYDAATHGYALSDHGNLTPVSRAVYLLAVAAQNRLFLGVTLVFLTAAFGVSYGDWSRHRPESSPFRSLPLPVRPRPRIPVPVPILAATAAVALALTAACGLVIFDRVSAWGDHAIYLHAGHPAAATLAAGQYTVFAGCTDEMTRCAHLNPSAVTIRDVGRPIDVVRDPSSDHDTEAEPFVGQLSFSIAHASAVLIELTVAPGQPVFVVPSEGQLARGLTGWIAAASAALLILLVSLACLSRLAWWRLTPLRTGARRTVRPYRTDFLR